MNEYEIDKRMGVGSYGEVFLALHKEENSYYVIKKMKMWDLKEDERQKIDNQVKLLREFRHINIVRYRDSFIDKEGYLNIVMTNCEGGDMYQLIQNSQGKKIDEKQIIDWAVQVALSIYYMHQKKILHRDLKTSNIFLNKNRVRMGDFGISKVLQENHNFLAQTNIGTPLYMSPEQFKNKPYSYKSDIWAFGCCLYEMCNQKHAFYGNSIQGLARKIFLGEYAPVSEHYSHGLRQLIHKMLSQNPKGRPTIIEILQRPFMKRRIQSYIKEIVQEGTYDNQVLQTLMQQGRSLGIKVENIFNSEPSVSQKSNSAKNARLESEQKLRKERERIREQLKEKLQKQNEEKKKMQQKIRQIEKQRKEMQEAAKNKRRSSYDRYVNNRRNSSQHNSSTNANSSVSQPSSSSRGFKKEESRAKSTHIKENPKPLIQQKKEEKKPFQMKQQHDMHYEESDQENQEQQQAFVNAVIQQQIDDEDEQQSKKAITQPSEPLISPIKEELVQKRQKTEPQKSQTQQQLVKTPLLAPEKTRKEEVEELKREVKEKTAKINMIETELQAIDFQFSSDSEDGQPSKKKQNPTYIRLKERANDLKHKIISKLGREGYNRFMKFAHSRAGKENKPSREEVTSLVGKELVGLWHLAEQIVSLDKIADSIPQFY